jgi:hypothetical protein
MKIYSLARGVETVEVGIEVRVGGILSNDLLCERTSTDLSVQARFGLSGGLRTGNDSVTISVKCQFL